MGAPMKVKLTFTVEVDVGAWSEKYGWMGRQGVREDVATYLATLVERFDAKTEAGPWVIVED